MANSARKSNTSGASITGTQLRSTGIDYPSPRTWAGVLSLTALLLWMLVGSCERAEFRRIEDLPGNFHVVDMGRMYRSAQPNERELETAIEGLGIRTVLNLRGPNIGSGWYDAERRVCEARGVRLIDVPMNASTLPSAETAGQILSYLQNLSYPVLVHCTGGSDRTGAVCALYRMSILGDDKSSSLAELSADYLHFRNLTPCMDRLAESFENRADWINQYRSIASQPCE
jgi:protein tyrosine/serine phosphatase